MSVRFAFKTANQNTTWNDVLAVWQEGDGIDLFESGWNFDHFYPIAGDSAGPCLEGWVDAGRPRSGDDPAPAGLPGDRDPLPPSGGAGEHGSTVDIISNGRLELGIGAGWNEEESDGYGIELGDRRERSDRFEEACEVLVRLLSQETSSYQGAYYTLSDARNEPKGPQQPYPPICIGGSGEKRTLLTTARYAQHWNYGGTDPVEFAHKRDVLYAHCQDIGRDPKEILLSTHVRLNDDNDVAKAAADAAALGEAGAELAIFYLRPPLSPAILEPLAKALEQLA